MRQAMGGAAAHPFADSFENSFRTPILKLLLTEAIHLSLDGELVHVLLFDLRLPRLLRLVQL